MGRNIQNINLEFKLHSRGYNKWKHLDRPAFNPNLITRIWVSIGPVKILKYINVVGNIDKLKIPVILKEAKEATVGKIQPSINTEVFAVAL